MCLNPLSKKNPYFGADPSKHMFHDTEHEYLNIPCGHCDECLATRQASYIQRLTAESKYNHFFFATLTYDNKHLPVLHLDVPTELVSQEKAQNALSQLPLFNSDGSLCSETLQELQDYDAACEERLNQCLDDPVLAGEDQPEVTFQPASESESASEVISIAYADIHHLQLMFKRMRDNNTLGRSFRYIAVSERGTKRGRPHFHIIFLVPKYSGDTLATCETLNQALKDMLLQYWSTNVGTRKNPVYERNFTYREAWIGRKLYRNFDCHYVNPVLTSDGVADVAYYVTKYIFKDSEKENALKQLVFCNTENLPEFHAVWDIVKSRCVASKGLGMDAVFYTVDRAVSISKPCFEVAQELSQQIMIQEDLPANDFEFAPISSFRTVWQKRRVMVPNFELMQELKNNALLDKETGHAIYVTYNGKHLPLATYYSRRILDIRQLTDLYYSWDPVKYPDAHFSAWNRSSDERKKIEKRLKRKLTLIDQHEGIDGRADIIESQGHSIDPYDKYRNRSKYLNLDGKVHTKIFLGK